VAFALAFGLAFGLTVDLAFGLAAGFAFGSVDALPPAFEPFAFGLAGDVPGVPPFKSVAEVAGAAVGEGATRLGLVGGAAPESVWFLPRPSPRPPRPVPELRPAPRPPAREPPLLPGEGEPKVDHEVKRTSEFERNLGDCRNPM
jgi:hypothetical protein